MIIIPHVNTDNGNHKYTHIYYNSNRGLFRFGLHLQVCRQHPIRGLKFLHLTYLSQL